MLTVDALAQEIRRVDGSKSLGAGALAEALLPFLSALPASEAGWRDMESAPKDGTHVDLWGINHLRYDKAGERICNVAFGPVRDWMGSERNDWQHGRGDDFDPTHWMPLPSAPDRRPA